MSTKFVEQNRKLLDVRECKTTIEHSNEGTTEESSHIVMNATVQIGRHSYTSNWTVANSRYDVLLGMPWHTDVKPEIDYERREISVGTYKLPVPRRSWNTPEISNLGVKKFRSLLRKHGHKEDFEVYQLVSINNSDFKTSKNGKHIPEDVQSKLDEIMTTFKGVFRDHLPPGLPPKRKVDHAIEVPPNSKPPHRPLFQLSPAELLATKEYVTDLLKRGKIRPSISPYGAPLFFVKQKGKLRGVIDYRALNRITKPNHAPIPRTDEMFDRIGRARVFSKLDLKAGFHQIRVREEDIEKTAFKTKYGMFEFMVMPMGLCNAPATFQALMNSIFGDCIDEFMVIYIDDILIYSDSYQDHLRHLETVLQKLANNELYVGSDKFEIMTDNTEFLGLQIGGQGVSVGDDRKKIIRDWPVPGTMTDLRSFLGLLQFFRRFIRDFSKIAAPLTDLTRKNGGIHKWNQHCQVAFDELKKRLCSSPIMVPPDWSKPFRCHVDASQLAVGGTLTQKDSDGYDRAIAYFSKRLSNAEENYTANDRELLGLVYFLKRFRCYLEGSEFEVVIDNQILSYYFTKPTLSRRETRWLEFLSQFGINKLTLEKGRVHVLGDALSRAPHAPPIPEINNTTASAIELCPDFHKKYCQDKLFGPVISGLKGHFPDDKVQKERIHQLIQSFKLEGNKLLFDGMVCVPRCFVKEIMHLAHDSKLSGHFSFTKTLARLQGFYWKNKLRDVENYCKGCLTCQQQKDSRQKPAGSPQPLQFPNRRWGSVASDFITHLPRTKRGYNAITTFVDRFSKRVHFAPSRDTDTAEDFADLFFRDIFRNHGLPDSLVSDRDPKFTSKFWKRLSSLCDIRLRLSTSHHPQTDGSSEIMNRMIENFLRCYCSHHQTDWDTLLTSAEFAYNSSRVESMGASPFELDLGWTPKSPLALLEGKPDDRLESINTFKQRLAASFKDAKFAHKLAQARQAAYNSRKYTPPAFEVGDSVWLDRKYFSDAYSALRPSQKLTARRFGPFKILQKIGRNAVRLQFPPHMRAHDVVHVEHLRPFRSQPGDISNNGPSAATPYVDLHGDTVVEIEQILGHRRKGRGYQFLSLPRGSPTHEACWQPLRDFVDDDGTITAALHSYIITHNLLPELH